MNVDFHVVGDGNLLFTDLGTVWNPANKGTIVDTYSVPQGVFLDSVIPDNSTGHTYYLNDEGAYSEFEATTVLAFDQTTLAQTGSLSVTFSATTSGTQLVRWGTNGFAIGGFNEVDSTDNGIMLFTSGIASTSNLTPAPAAVSLSPASAQATGPGFTLTVNGSDFVTGSTVLWNGAPRLTTVVSSKRLTATVYASDIEEAGSAQVVVTNPGVGGGTSQALSFAITAP